MEDFVVCYGSSEVVIVAMSYPTDTPEERWRSAGHVMDHIELAVFNKKGQLVNRGEKGEVCIRGYSVMIGYYNDEEKTKKAIKPDRWYRTGYVVGRVDGLIVNCLSDMGFMNHDGSVVICDRFIIDMN
uniref:AMP-dependent synthetase/ligase domain-containing protein n=1 Tax=Panagrolaimus sp. JU765 TaxID=591449 RepID=A0AC34RG71_9BILA